MLKAARRVLRNRCMPIMNYRKLLADCEEARATFPANHPQHVKIGEQIEEIRVKIKREEEYAASQRQQS
jgi:hypothetical protein